MVSVLREWVYSLEKACLEQPSPGVPSKGLFKAAGSPSEPGPVLILAAI